MASNSLHAGAISADDHVLESPDVWTARLSKSKWGDRIPHIESTPAGDRWSIDGRSLPLFGRSSLSEALDEGAAQATRWSEVPAVAYNPAERLRALDRDGIAFSVLYPTVAGVAGEALSAIEDPALQLACIQAYNDWTIEVWAHAGDRFIPQCIVPLAASDVMAGEVRRAAGKGHRGAVMPIVPSMVRADAPQLNDPCYDAVWRACEELDVPVCFHAGASEKQELQPPDSYSPGLARAFAAISPQQTSAIGIPNLLVSRILDRFPRLRVIFGGASAGWIDYILETTENSFNFTKTRDSGYKRSPIEAFKDQCHVVSIFDDERSLRRACDSAGARNVLWGSEFPLALSTWPQSKQFIDAASGLLSASERESVFVENAATLYKIKVPAA